MNIDWRKKTIHVSFDVKQSWKEIAKLSFDLHIVSFSMVVKLLTDTTHAFQSLSPSCLSNVPTSMTMLHRTVMWQTFCVALHYFKHFVNIEIFVCFFNWKHDEMNERNKNCSKSFFDVTNAFLIESCFSDVYRTLFSIIQPQTSN